MLILKAAVCDAVTFYCFADRVSSVLISDLVTELMTRGCFITEKRTNICSKKHSFREVRSF